MSFLHLLVYLGGALLALFLVLSLASGLYYLAELVEEYTVLTKKIIKYCSIFVAACHLFLWIVDQLPIVWILFSLCCHGVYAQLLDKFPNIQLMDPVFILTCVMVVSDHFVWFFYFMSHPLRFIEIATFFGIIIWLIPFMYFISLSANEYTLPTSDPSFSGTQSKRKANIVKSILNFVLQKKTEILPSQMTSTVNSQVPSSYNAAPADRTASINPMYYSSGSMNSSFAGEGPATSSGPAYPNPYDTSSRPFPRSNSGYTSSPNTSYQRKRAD